MKKSFTIILLLTFLLTSCNFPLTQATPDMNLVDTSVAATLAAAETKTLPTVPVLHVATQPHNTPSPSVTSTLTPTATSTPLAGDPAESLGEPGFQDTFTNGTAFGLNEPYEDDAVTIHVENGAMVFESKKIKTGLRWRLTSRNPQNLYLEGTFRTVSCSGTDQYGLVLRAPSYSDGNGYYFGVTCNGQYYLMRWIDDKQDTILSLTPDARILSGSGQSNRLGFMADGDHLRLYINGVLLSEITDQGIVDKGYIGAFVSAYEDADFKVNLEDIKLWTLP